MAAGTPLSAKAAKVRIGATTMYHTSWDVDDAINYADTTNFESAGYAEQVSCIRQAKVRLSGWLDVGANPFDTPNINVGQQVNLNLYFQNTAGPVWAFPTFDIETVKVTANVREEIKLEITGMTKGSYVDPTGNL